MEKNYNYTYIRYGYNNRFNVFFVDVYISQLYLRLELPILVKQKLSSTIIVYMVLVTKRY